MGFRINRGIFQYKDGEDFRNKFKIAEDGNMVEVDVDGNPTTAYMKIGDKATDADKLDGIDSGAFLRSNANDTFTGTLTMGKQHALVANNYGRGVYGIYSSTKYQHVWSMGTAYNLADNGSNTGNLYGVAWTHSNAGGESISGLGHQMLIMSNGDTRSAIGDGIWTKYNVYASGGNSTEWNAAYGWGNHDGLYIRTYYGGKNIDELGTYIAAKDDGGWAGGARMPSAHNGYGAITMHLHTGNYYGQIHLSANTSDMGVRFQNGSSSWTSIYKVWTENHFGQGNINNWNTAYNWGNHSGLYDTVGSASEVDNRIETEIKPLITTAQSTADGAVTTANSALTTAETAEARANSAREEAAAAQSTADGKLGATAKAADSNLLDGVDSSRFVYGGNSTKTTNVSSVSTALASGFYDGYNITGTPTSTWYTYINMRHNNTGNNYGSQIAVSFYSNADMYVRTISNGTYQGWSKIWNSANFDPNSKENAGTAASAVSNLEGALTPQIATAQSTATNAATAASNAQATADTALSDAGKAATAAANAQSTADGKLGSTAKAADSDKLDGYDWMQSGKNIRGTEIYADNWFRNYNVNEGLYNEATGTHFVSNGSGNWTIRDSDNGIELRLQTNGTTTRGYVYANNSNEVGFLDAGGSWAIRHYNDSGTDFYTDNGTREFIVGKDRVSGGYGTVQTSTTRGGWGGYSINGQYVFMSNHNDASGIYNDIDNEWMTIWRRNGSTELYHNGSKKLETTSGGATVTGTMTATSFSGDGSGLTGITAPVDFINQPEGTTSQLASITFDGRGLIFTMADGNAFSLDGARPL